MLRIPWDQDLVQKYYDGAEVPWANNRPSAQLFWFVLAMKGLSLLVILVASVLAMINGSPLNFRGMIQRITGKNALIYFEGYGCYCGKEGKGKPRDRTDMCCYHLGCCYESLDMHKCHPMIDHYNFHVVEEEVICEKGEKPGCSTWLCECDREASLCLKREAQTYKSFYHHYPEVLCKEITPKCPPGEGVVQQEENLSLEPQGERTLT
ncbi:basic phospholipase A2 homolog Gln49-PLA2-like isoform X2 [Paroedura picta]|uniref:basic phospholipase A2 homolog Gln49-PLA2-like isoform X2 n=1 Tax=Paroedura picta TaxID=143630 RepID=UPI0040561404